MHNKKRFCYLDGDRSEFFISVRKNENYRSTCKVFIIKNVTESDIEKYLCSGTPIDKNGNLTKISSSALSSHFAKERLTDLTSSP